MLKDEVNEQELGTLDEQNRSLYIKTGEGDATTYKLHPAVVAERTSLTTKNAEILREKQAKADALKPFEGLGKTADEIKAIVEKHQQTEDSKKTEDERRQSQIESLKTSNQREIDNLKTTAAQREEFLTKNLRNVMINTTASLAIEKAGGEVEALLPHITAAMDLVEEGEGDERKFQTRIVDGAKAPRYSGADFMNVEQLVEEFKKKPAFMGLFKASGKGGSGAPSNQQNRTTSHQRNASEMSSTDKIAQGLAQRGR